MIDLRSDTVTKPTEGMRQAMASAEVGDDVYGEDPTVAELQERVAGLFGFEAALFTPDRVDGQRARRWPRWSGRARRCSASRGRTSCAPSSAPTARSPGSPRAPGSDEDGQIDLAAIRSMYAPDMGPFFVRTTAISVENTHNFAGGTVLPSTTSSAARCDDRVRRTVDGAHLERPRRDGAAASYGAVADPWRSASPRAGRRSAR